MQRITVTVEYRYFSFAEFYFGKVITGLAEKV